MHLKFTKTEIEKISRESRLRTGDKLVLRDTEVRGLQAVIRPSGTVGFYVYYRTETGQQRRPKFGEFPAMTVPQARKKAQRLLGQVHLGEDPSADKKAQRSAPLVNDLIDRFTEDHVKLRLKQTTQDEIEAIMRDYVKPAIGRKLVKEVSRSDIEKLHKSMASKPTRANHALAWIKVMMNKAIHWDLRESNPCVGVRQYPTKPRERWLSDSELKSLGEALQHLEQGKLRTLGAINAIRLLALTGLRHGEILGLTWNDIDFDRGEITLRDSKTGNRSLPMGATVKAFLAELEGKREGPQVLCGIDPKKPLHRSVVSKTWRHACRLADIKDARIHDLRHTFGTYTAQTGANSFLVRDALGHKTLAMTGRYVNKAVDPLVAVKDKVENRVAAAMGAHTHSDRTTDQTTGAVG